MTRKDLKGKKILIVGMGRTGLALAHFLVQAKAQVVISDHKSEAELDTSLKAVADIKNKVHLDLGGHTPKLFLEQDIVVLSPGISPYLRIFEYVRQRGVMVTGELEFASRFVTLPIIAITGTNGKTSTACLTYEMLKESGRRPWVGGNYNEPLSSFLLEDETQFDVLVLELSSFQLEHVEKLSPKHIVFTNLAQGHQDRHRNMEEYVNAKRKVFTNTTKDTTSILNADDNAVVELARDPRVQKGRIFYFSRQPALEPQIMNIGGCVQVGTQIRVRTGPEVEYFDVDDIKVRGEHMSENIMGAILAAREHGASHEAIQTVMNEFNGLAHRLEYVRRVGGVDFYNDSKATNAHAVERALSTFDENVILIMGGKDTNLTYTGLQNAVKEKVKNLLLVGEAKERINRDVGDFAETFLVGTFDEAVVIAYQKSRIGDTVLLSPGCSSHDVFSNYVERGDHFKSLVRKFK